MKRVHVIGAGLSGLAAAWRLSQAGCDVEMTEASDRVGGLLGTAHTPHGLVERGANAFLWNDTTARWFHELEIEPIFPLPQSRRRYLFRDGRPRRWPLAIDETLGLATHAAIAWMRRRLKPEGDESVADWSRRVAGHAATDWIVAPALQGAYAAPADRLAARLIFGRTRNANHRRRRALSVAPRRGMGEFVDALVRKLRARGVHIRLSTSIDGLDSSVPTVVSTGVRGAATLLAPHAATMASALGAVETTALVSATAFFQPRTDDIQGFGVLFPRQCGVQALGVLFNNSIFEGRGVLRSETWIYGEFGSPQGLPHDVPAAIEHDREVLTQRHSRPVAVYSGGPDDHGRAELPVYGPSVLRATELIASLPPWLALAGNYLGRLGVATLLDVSSDAAAGLAPQRTVSWSSAR